MNPGNALILLQAAMRLVELAARAVERGGDVTDEEMDDALARARAARRRWAGQAGGVTSGEPVAADAAPAPPTPGQAGGVTPTTEASDE